MGREADVRLADPSLRRALLVLVLVIAAGASLAILVGMPALEERLRSSTPEEALELVQWVFLALFLPLVGFGAYFVHLGRRTVEANEFPPPRLRVIKDTPVYRGRAARFRGYVLMGVGGTLVLIGLYGAFEVPRELERLFEKVLRSVPPDGTPPSPEPDGFGRTAEG